MEVNFLQQILWYKISGKDTSYEHWLQNYK